MCSRYDSSDIFREAFVTFHVEDFIVKLKDVPDDLVATIKRSPRTRRRSTWT